MEIVFSTLNTDEEVWRIICDDPKIPSLPIDENDTSTGIPRDKSDTT